jgi:hypothetical protein
VASASGGKRVDEGSRWCMLGGGRDSLADHLLKP